MALLTGTSITFTIQYAFQINKPTRKKKPGKPKTCRVEKYKISYGNLALISTTFYFTQLIVDFICAKIVDKI